MLETPSLLCVLLILTISSVRSFPTLPDEPLYPKTVYASLTAEMSRTNLDEQNADTDRIQRALTDCPVGAAVKLIANFSLFANDSMNAFITAPLILPTGVSLWIDKSVTLFASINVTDYDKSPGSCGVTADINPHGCNPLISATNTVNSSVVGEGAIDGRGGAILLGRYVSWWDMGLDATRLGKSQTNPRLIQVDGGSNFVIYKTSFHNGPKFHIVPNNINGFIAWGIKILTPTTDYPKYNSSTAKNTDGIDPSGATNVVIAYTSISTGDDNIAIKALNGATNNTIIAHNHFYKGHGMSIGSETTAGVNNILVTNLTLDGTDNGIRIKSDSTNGGPVRNIRYEQICVKDVANPLVFDTYYSTKTGSRIPDFQGIVVSGARIVSSSKHQSIFRGYNATYPLKITLDNVQSDVLIDKFRLENVEIIEGPGVVRGLNFSVTDGVKISGSIEDVPPITCNFPDFQP